MCARFNHEITFTLMNNSRLRLFGTMATELWQFCWAFSSFFHYFVIKTASHPAVLVRCWCDVSAKVSRLDIGALRSDSHSFNAANSRFAKAWILEAQDAARFTSFWYWRGRHLVAWTGLLERRFTWRQSHRIRRHGATGDDGTCRSVAGTLDRAKRAI